MMIIIAVTLSRQRRRRGRREDAATSAAGEDASITLSAAYRRHRAGEAVGEISIGGRQTWPGDLASS